jgi:hypothetical protein
VLGWKARYKMKEVIAGMIEAERLLQPAKAS